MKNKKFLVYTFLFFSFYSFGCNAIPLFEISSTEHYRVKSPDGEVDAVLMKSDGGATTSFSYSLFLLPKGTSSKKLSLDDSRLIADRAESLKITWIKSFKLTAKVPEFFVFQIFGNRRRFKIIDT